MDNNNRALKVPEAIYKMTATEVYDFLSGKEEGLDPEAVAERQKLQGKNVIVEKKKKSPILVFLKNFTHLMAILLWIGGAVAFFADMPELGIAIWLVNVINGVFSYWQEHRASKATDALKNMLPSYVRVIRNGLEEKILSEDLVIGDIMLLAEGDKISADGRLIECSDLKINQSTFTGEATLVRKSAEANVTEEDSIADIPNLVLTGTSVAEGNGRAIVYQIGMDTEFGKIAGLTQETDGEPSPLQKEMDRITKQVSLIAVGTGILFFIASILLVNEPVAASFIFALGMVVAFIPEGLLPTVTLSLAKAVQRMAKRNALVKTLSSVETLGSTTVICTDKTGTLTQNEMTVCNLSLGNRSYKVTGAGYGREGEILLDKKHVTAKEDSDLSLLLTAAALCSNAKLLKDEKKGYTVLGDPTEACLEVVAAKAGITIEEEKTLAPRIKELPFESRRKRMTTIHHLDKPFEGSKRIAYVKGAPKEILNISKEVRIEGKREALTGDIYKRIMNDNDEYSRKGLRVIAVAYRTLDEDISLPSLEEEYTPEIIEENLVFIGLIVMADPPRANVAEAVEECRSAGIRIIMITGDYGLTAESIARQIGIVKIMSPRIISGPELQRISDDQLKEYLKEEIIFARVAPEQKLRVVSCLQELGEIVAVTGDGVNDAPALKKADIGVAMGISGTDVAKEAADMVLTDDNFASIVHAIEEGRAVYNNIRRFILYILNSNMSEAVPSALFLFSKGAIPLPLTVMQILTIDLGTDMLPALGLGCEKPEKGIMNKPPRNQKEPLLDSKIFVKAFLWYGLLGSIVSAFSYFFVNMENGWPKVPLAAGADPVYIKATTMTLAAIVFSQIAAVYNCRTDKESVFSVGLMSNKQVNFGVVMEVLIIAALVYLPPLQSIFHTGPLDGNDWLLLCIWPLAILIIEEVRKAILRRSTEGIVYRNLTYRKHKHYRFR